jgi:hypothetical protein
VVTVGADGIRRGFGSVCEHVEALVAFRKASMAAGALDAVLMEAWIAGVVDFRTTDREEVIDWKCRCGLWHQTVFSLSDVGPGAEEVSLAARLSDDAVHFGMCRFCLTTWVDPEPGDRCACGMLIVGGGA